MFEDFDLGSFWERSDYADENFVDDPLTDDKVEIVEAALGFKLPAAYLVLARSQNGGIPTKTCHRMTVRTTWAEDHIAITGILSIGYAKSYSLCGERGSKFWPERWEYPPIGVYFATCPSAGHDMLCLDYRACGPEGEPTVVHVDQEWDYKVTLVATSFEAFIRGLEVPEEFETA